MDIINYVYDRDRKITKFALPYWSNTSSNSIIREMVGEADQKAKADLETLINGGTIEKQVHEDITYGDIHQSQDNLWNFLFFTGYLKKVGERKKGNNLKLEMKIRFPCGESLRAVKTDHWKGCHGPERRLRAMRKPTSLYRAGRQPVWYLCVCCNL